MKDTHNNLPVQKQANPTTPGTKPDVDELARLWVEMVLQQLRNTDSRFLKNKFIKLNK